MVIERLLTLLLAISMPACAASPNDESSGVAAASLDDASNVKQAGESGGGKQKSDTQDNDKEGDDEDASKDDDTKVTIALGEGEVRTEYELEIAADLLSRSEGLGGRKEIPEKTGMIFVYTRAELRRFWMINCLVDIDIIYLDANGVIVATHAMKAEPLRQPGESQSAYEGRLKRHSSRRPAQFAIELRAGEVKRLGVKPGQEIEFDREKLVEIAKTAERISG